MADHDAGVEHDSFVESVMDKIKGHDSSSSDFDDDKKDKKSPSSDIKSKIYRLFGRESPAHKVFGGGKPTPKEQLCTELLMGYVEVIIFVGSGSEVASQETYGTLGAIIRSQTGNRQVGFLINLRQFLY